MNPLDLESGNTSACAEKRAAGTALLQAVVKYLRVRGEEPNKVVQISGDTEIPPRARRREDTTASLSSTVGNTSACAEKSFCGVTESSVFGKYLRVRGEEYLVMSAASK